MGIFDKIKQAVGGPISIALIGPETFTWADAVLPISATLTNNSDEPLAVAELRFTLELAAAGSNAKKNAAKSTRKRMEPGGFTLGPGETVVRAVDFPLNTDTGVGAMKQAASDAGLPDWVGVGMKGVMGELPRHVGAHKVGLTVKLDGSARLSNATRTVRAT